MCQACAKVFLCAIIKLPWKLDKKETFVCRLSVEAVFSFV